MRNKKQNNSIFKFEKIFSIFKKEKNNFKNIVKKEKKRFYMFKEKKSSFLCTRKKNKQTQIKFNYKINKKKILIFISVILILSLISLIYVFKWNYFSIQKIIININDNVTNETIAYKSLDLIRNKSIFLEWTQSISKKLIDYQKNISYVKVKKNLPNILEINIESYPIIIDIIYANKKYSLTSNWIVVPYKKTNKENNRIILKISNSEKDIYRLLNYKKFIEIEKLEKIYNLIKTFEKNLLELEINEILFYQKEREIHIITKNETIFIFSLEENISKQLKKILVYSKWKNNSLRQIYIDLRIQNKIFICPYKSEYQCKINLKRIYK